MSNANNTARALPFLEGFSNKDRQLAEKGLTQQDERRRKASDSRGQKGDQVVEHFRRQLHDLLGAKKLAELRQAIQHERLAFRDLWQPPLDLTRDIAKEKKARNRRLEAVLKKLGANPAQLQKIGSESSKKLRDILSAAEGKVVPGYSLPKHLDKWMSLSPLHKLPLPWGMSPDLPDPNDPHRWFLFRPPFFGFLFRYDPQFSDNFRVDRQLFLDPSAGLVGNIATMDCGDADDIDYASVTAESQIAVAFEAPTAGLVEVLIDAQSTIGTHDLSLVDEWGSSDAWTNQNNNLMMNVLSPNVPEPSLSLMSNCYTESDGDDKTVHQENLVRGKHYFAHLFSSGPVAAGQSVIVTAGTRTFDIAFTNDMEVHSKTNFQWFINSLEVRISP